MPLTTPDLFARLGRYHAAVEAKTQTPRLDAAGALRELVRWTDELTIRTTMEEA